MKEVQLALHFQAPLTTTRVPVAARPRDPHSEQLAAPTAAGEKAKARDILAAIRTLKQVEQEHRPPTPEERQALLRFCGFGPVALSIFPNPKRSVI